MRKLHAKFHSLFLEACLKNFTNETQNKVCIEIEIGNAIITFYVDLIVENYTYDESTNSADYDRSVYVRGYEPVRNNKSFFLNNLTRFLFKNYYSETFNL
jgi:hypothetical protein